MCLATEGGAECGVYRPACVAYDSRQNTRTMNHRLSAGIAIGCCAIFAWVGYEYGYHKGERDGRKEGITSGIILEEGGSLSSLTSSRRHERLGDQNMYAKPHGNGPYCRAIVRLQAAIDSEGGDARMRQRAEKTLSEAVSELRNSPGFLDTLSHPQDLRAKMERMMDRYPPSQDERPTPSHLIRNIPLGGHTNAVLTMTLDEKIADAGVIVLASRLMKEGEIVSVITEVLKHDTGIKFNHDVGSVIDRQRHTAESHIGEAAIVFCTGSPAHGVYFVSVHDGVIPGFDEMTLGQFRERVRTLSESDLGD